MNLSIPQSWETVQLQELATLTLGGDWGKAPEFEDPKYSIALCIRGAEFRHWESEKGSTASLRKIKNTSLASRTLEIGDILVEISGGGPDQPVGRTVLIDKSSQSHSPEVPKICTNFVRLLRTCNEIDSCFLNFYLQFFYKSGEIRNYQAGSNNLRNLKFSDYLGLDIPLPPIFEQHRIVAKIEELFSELDKGLESLKTAQAQLKVYRQALLKHAFEGKLTAQWRADNPDKLESADALLKRIQQEREQRYQQQLSDWEAGDKQGSKPRAPKALPPLTDEELAALSELSKGWEWLKVGSIGVLGTGATPLKSRSEYYTNGTIPWVTSGALNAGYVSDASDYVTELALKETNLRRYPIHTLLVAMYGEGKTRGKCSELLIEATTNQAIAAIVLEGAGKELRPYIKWFFQKNYGDIRLKSSGGVQPNLNLNIVENTPVPMCGLSEAKQIVELIEFKLSEIDQLDNTITTSLQQAEALRQSILKKAYTGQLVPQDASDEPASLLLARIQAEKAAPSPSKKARK